MKKVWCTMVCLTTTIVSADRVIDSRAVQQLFYEREPITFSSAAERIAALLQERGSSRDKQAVMQAVTGIYAECENQSGIDDLGVVGAIFITRTLKTSDNHLIEGERALGMLTERVLQRLGLAHD